MKSSLLLLCLLFPLICFGGNWVELKFEDGKVGQIRIDFEIYELEFSETGYYFNAKAERNGKEVGFGFELDSKWRMVPIPVQNKKEIKLFEQHSGAKILNIGRSTNNLDDMLNKFLKYSEDDKDSKVCSGLYNVSAPLGYTHESVISIFRLTGVGIAFDNENKNTMEENFQISMIVDLPAKKVIVYFGLQGGYGGYPSEHYVRREWSKKKGQPVAGGDGTR